MVEYDRTPLASNGSTDSLRICVAGVGGAGSNVLDRITMDRTVDAMLVSFQTDVRVLNRSSAPSKVQLGTDLMRGVGSGGDPDLGREAAMFSKDEIRAALEGHDMVFISAGLGGGTGSGAAPVIAEIAKSTGAIVVVFATVPFSFEGRRRQQQSGDALERLQKCTDALILFDNNRMGELVLPKDGIQKAFAQGDQLIAQSVRAVTGIVSAPGLVKLGLDDLVSALRVSEGRCLFGFGESKGKDRGAEALKRALKSPLINQGELLENAKTLLVHVVGGESLTLAEVEQIMKQLGRYVPDETQILFGTGVDPKMSDSIAVTLISALSVQDMASARRVIEQHVSVRPVRAAVVKTAVAPPVTQDAEDLFQGNNGHTPSAAMEAARASIAPPPVELLRPEAPVARVVAQPAPAPVPVAEEIVYAANEEVEEEAIEMAPLPTVATAPLPRDAARSRLMSFISTEKASPHPEKAKAAPSPPVDEIEIEAPLPAVVEAVAETVPVTLSRTTPQVRPAAAIENVVVSRVAPPEEEPEPVATVDLFGSAAPTQPAPVKKAVPVPVEQQTLSLGGDKSGRFKDTEPSYATQGGGDDLDVPTWMRLRRRANR
jgi:cell division protein FtsZ